MGEVLGLSCPPTPESVHTPLLRVRRRKAGFRLFSSPWRSFISPHGGERTNGVFFLWWHIEWRVAKKMAANKCPHGVSKTVPCDKCITELTAKLVASTKAIVESELWAVSSDGERFGHEDFASREEAIREGVIAYGGQSFYVGRIERPTQPEEWFEAEDWLELVSGQDEYAGDHAEDWDNSTPEQRAELTEEIRKVMAAWLDRHRLRPTFWNVANPELIVPDE